MVEILKALNELMALVHEKHLKLNQGLKDLDVAKVTNTEFKAALDKRAEELAEVGNAQSALVEARRIAEQNKSDFTRLANEKEEFDNFRNNHNKIIKKEKEDIQLKQVELSQLEAQINKDAAALKEEKEDFKKKLASIRNI